MAKVWNPTEEKIETKIFGNYFQFAPGQMKNMNSSIADFVNENRRDTGLVVLPAEFDPMNEEQFIEGYDKTPEGKAILAQKKTEGINNLVRFHLKIVQNNQISFRRDIARHDPASDPSRLAAVEASKGELESMRLVSKYRKMKLDVEERQVNEVEKLMQEIGPTGK